MGSHRRGLALSGVGRPVAYLELERTETRGKTTDRGQVVPAEAWKIVYLPVHAAQRPMSVSVNGMTNRSKDTSERHPRIDTQAHTEQRGPLTHK